MAGFDPGLHPGDAVQLPVHRSRVKGERPILRHGLLCLVGYITVKHLCQGLQKPGFDHLVHLRQGNVHHIRKITAGKHQVHPLVILFFGRQEYIFNVNVEQLPHFGAPEAVLIIRGRRGGGNAGHGRHLYRLLIFSEGIPFFYRYFCFFYRFLRFFCLCCFRFFRRLFCPHAAATA